MFALKYLSLFDPIRIQLSKYTIVIALCSFVRLMCLPIYTKTRITLRREEEIVRWVGYTEMDQEKSTS